MLLVSGGQFRSVEQFGAVGSRIQLTDSMRRTLATFLRGLPGFVDIFANFVINKLILQFVYIECLVVLLNIFSVSPGASEISTNSAVKTPLFRRLDKELRARREAMLEERGWKVTSDERQRS